MRVLKTTLHQVVGIDIIPSTFTSQVGSITDKAFVGQCLQGVEAVLHTATLHKPHIVTHTYQQFVETNITGTLTLLQEALSAGVSSFVFTSTTSSFGAALTPPAGAPAAWITEEVTPIPKNIYGVTKTAAEDLCQLFHRKHRLPCIVLRTSRFFPEEDDNKLIRLAYPDENVKVNELLYRRVDVEDVVTAHLLALEKATSIGFGRYIISATTPFTQEDLVDLPTKATQVVKRLFPHYESLYQQQGWQMFPGIERVYVNQRAREELGWQPRYDFAHALDRLRAGADPRSPLARVVGAKGYHPDTFAEGPYPIE